MVRIEAKICFVTKESSDARTVFLIITSLFPFPVCSRTSLNISAITVGVLFQAKMAR